MISPPPCKFNERGFTLVELVMVIILLGVLATVSITTINTSTDQARFDATVLEMSNIRDALIGDPTLSDSNGRTSYGYLGDVGSLPTTAQGLNALITKPSTVNPWVVNTAVRFGLGWKGPYLVSTMTADFSTDSWGTAYVYDSSTSPAKLTSLGADKTVGGTGFNQDIVVQIPTSLQKAKVDGFISQSGSPYVSTATVEMNYPNGAGAVTTSSVSLTAADAGHFSFSNVPLGMRSATIYIPNKAAATTTLGPVLFNVDRDNYVISSTLTDTGASAGGGGGGGGGGASVCPTPAGIIVRNSATAIATSQGGKRVNWGVDITRAVVVSKVYVTLTTYPSRTHSATQINSLNRTYTATAINTWVTLSPTISSAAATNTNMYVQLNSSVLGEMAMDIYLTHDQGCDKISLVGPL